ncbi:MAG: hypothetical protein AB4352_21210 [Hormoscilla sp.]
MPRITLDKEPLMPDGHLFEFCSRDYWESLSIKKLLVWTEGVCSYLRIPAAYGGIGSAVSYTDPWDRPYPPKGALTLDSHLIEEFDEQDFDIVDLHEFLCWAGQRILWLSREFCDSE